MQSEQTFLLKTFIITNGLTGTAVQCDISIPYISSTRELNFSRALSQIHSSVTNLSNSQIFYLDFQKRMHVFIGQYPFHQEIYLNHELFAGQNIQIQYRKIVSSCGMSQQPCPPEPKKKKVKQRTIKEAIDAVRQWRELYEIIDQKGKRKYTLQSAAQKVGYAKKTLDDYFNQLRLAQYYGFDFTRHQYDKIGVLRRFVKSYQKQQEQNSNNKIQDERYESSQDDIDKYLKDNNSSDDEDALF